MRRVVICALLAGCGAGPGLGKEYESCTQMRDFHLECDQTYDIDQHAQCDERLWEIEQTCGSDSVSTYEAATSALINCLQAQSYCPGDDLTEAVDACYGEYYVAIDPFEQCRYSDTGDTGDTDTGNGGPGTCSAPEAIGFAPEAAGGTTVALYDDEVSGELPIGFDLLWFGETVSTFQVSSNGFVTFGGGLEESGCCEGQPIPLGDHLDGVLALGWSDLNPAAGGAITAETRGTSPDRRLVITFDAVPIAYSTDTLTAQAIVYETTHLVELHTTQLPAGSIWTQGAESPDGSVAWCLDDRVASDVSVADDAIRIDSNAEAR